MCITFKYHTTQHEQPSELSPCQWLHCDRFCSHHVMTKVTQHTCNRHHEHCMIGTFKSWNLRRQVRSIQRVTHGSRGFIDVRSLFVLFLLLRLVCRDHHATFSTAALRRLCLCLCAPTTTTFKSVSILKTMSLVSMMMQCKQAVSQENCWFVGRRWWDEASRAAGKFWSRVWHRGLLSSLLSFSV